MGEARRRAAFRASEGLEPRREDRGNFNPTRWLSLPVDADGLVELQLPNLKAWLPPKVVKHLHDMFVGISTEAFRGQGMAAFECPREHTAIHEAGHAVIGHLGGEIVTGIEVWPEWQAGKEVWSGITDWEEVLQITPDSSVKTDLLKLRRAFAGVASEMTFLGKNFPLGSSIDELSEMQLYATNIACKTDVDEKSVLAAEMMDTFQALQEHEPAIRRIARHLTLHRSMNREEILAAMADVQEDAVAAE